MFAVSGGYLAFKFLVLPVLAALVGFLGPFVRNWERNRRVRRERRQAEKALAAHERKVEAMRYDGASRAVAEMRLRRQRFGKGQRR